MKEKVLGVYLGVDGVGVAEFENKRLTTSTYLPYTALEAEVASFNDLTEEVKAEALLQRALRKAKAEAVKAVVSFSGRDFTFRKMNMPLLKKKELEFALPLEIEKYIPFKVEDVAWAYKTKPNIRDRKTSVAFLSTKKDSMTKVNGILKSVGLDAIRVDSSVLAMFDALVALKKIGKKDRVTVTVYVGEKEADITIFEDHFPTFSRYTKVPLDFEGKFNVHKFADDVRMTLEYYRREAGKAQFDKIAMVVSAVYQDAFVGVTTDFGVPVQVIAFETLLAKHSFASIYEFHAYALGLRAYEKATVGFDISAKVTLAANDKDIMNFFKAQAPDEPFDPRLSIAVTALGALSFAVSFFWTKALLVPIEQERTVLIEKLADNDVTVAMSPKLETDIASLSEIHKKLKGVAVPAKRVSKFLAAFSDSVTEGLWVSNIQVDGDLAGTYSLVIDGCVYINNPDEERKSLNMWIDRLKGSASLIELSYVVNLINVERGKIGSFDVTKFQVRLDPNE